MKKKTMFLLLLILAGMWIFLSQNGWSALAPGWGPRHDPWSEGMLCYSGNGNNPNNPDTAVDAQNSIPTNTGSKSVSQVQSAFKRGDKVLKNFQQTQGNSGQVDK